MTEAEMQDKLLRMEERYKRTIIDLKAQIKRLKGELRIAERSSGISTEEITAREEHIALLEANIKAYQQRGRRNPIENFTIVWQIAVTIARCLVHSAFVGWAVVALAGKVNNGELWGLGLAILAGYSVSPLLFLYRFFRRFRVRLVITAKTRELAQ